MVGTTISHYKILEKLGEGGMGTVYRATHVQMENTVAVKILHPHLASDQYAVERFRREARSAAQIRHPNAVAVTDFGVTREQGIAYLVMGLWVFSQRWNTSAGRAFAYVCAWAAISNVLLFDLSTTHLLTGVWTIAISQIGGALIYLAIRDRKFAVVGDDGIHAAVPPDFWDAVRDAMADDFRRGRFCAGVCDGVSAIGRHLKTYFPWTPSDRDELPDRVSTGEEG